MKTEVQTPVQTEVSFVPKSVSWRSDVLTQAEKIVQDMAKEKGARPNLSAFVNEAVQEKIARQRTGDNSSLLQQIIRKELQCLLAPQLQQFH